MWAGCSRSGLCQRASESGTLRHGDGGQGRGDRDRKGPKVGYAPKFWERPRPAAVIRGRRAKNPPESHQRRTAERLKASYTELDTGHHPMLSQPAELVDLLVRER